MDFSFVANNLYDMLINLGYANEEDKALDLPDVEEDLRNAYAVVPRLVNLLIDISDRTYY